jgi:type IV pilus assembly protein PilM
MPVNLFSKLFLQYFPVPSFLIPSAFGMDISDESLKYVELIKTKTGIKVGRYGEISIPPKVIESGKIKDPKKIEEILSTLKKEKGVKSVRVSLPEEQIYLFKLQLEKEELVNVRESIELVLEEHIPLSAQDAIFDYEILGEDEKNLELQVATLPKNIIESYLSLFKNVGMLVQSFELEAQAVSRSVVGKDDSETYMIVDFGERRTGIFIMSRGIVMFTSTLDIGGVMLTNMIAKNFKISHKEAEEMKKKYGLQRNIANREIFSVVLNSVSVLRDEIVKHYTYWHTHTDEKGKNNPPIKKIILCGGDSNLIGLADYFAISMKSKVEIANVWINILDTEKYIPKIGFAEALAFSSALGLALGNFTDD